MNIFSDECSGMACWLHGVGLMYTAICTLHISLYYAMNNWNLKL